MKREQIALTDLRDNCRHAVVDQVKGGDGQDVAMRCTSCLVVTSSLCPVCDQWFTDAAGHQNRGFGVCGYFMRRGELHVHHKVRQARREFVQKQRKGDA